MLIGKSNSVLYLLLTFPIIYKTIFPIYAMNAYHRINPLLHIGHYCIHMAKILILKYEGMMQKSYERRVYG